MFEILFKIWYFIVIFPILIMLKGYAMFKDFMHRHGIGWPLLYFLLIILSVLLIILWIFGYR